MAKGSKLPKKEKLFWGHCSLCGSVIPDKNIYPLRESQNPASTRGTRFSPRLSPRFGETGGEAGLGEAGLQSRNEKEEGGTFYGECDSCKSSHVMTVFRNSTGVITVLSMITDLTQKDLSRIYELSPISADEILEVHEWFKSHKK